MNSIIQESSQNLDQSIKVGTEPVISVINDMSPAKNDMNITETTEPESEIGKSEQTLIPREDYSDSCLRCSGRLLRNIAFGLLIDAVKSGLFSLDS